MTSRLQAIIRTSYNYTVMLPPDNPSFSQEINGNFWEALHCKACKDILVIALWARQI